MTEGIMSWKVLLHVSGNNAMRGQQAPLLLGRVMGKMGVVVGYKWQAHTILMRGRDVKKAARCHKCNDLPMEMNGSWCRLQTP